MDKKKIDQAVELVRWVSTADDLPDAGVTVLLFSADSSEPVWPGFFDEEAAWGYVWRTASGNEIEWVTHWAEMPGGPVEVVK